MVAEGYAFFILGFWIVLTVYLLFNSYKIRYLKSVTVLNDHLLPSVAVVIAVRNEEANLEKALQSVCQLGYPHYRVIVVNDRSTDGTQGILQKFEQDYPSINILQINELPEGWLGKNHALYQGYQQSREEWLLFTDADVEFCSDSLRKALSYCVNEHLDHLVVLPDVISRSQVLNSVLETFKLMLEVRQRPWAARNPKSDASIGVGAFNLVKRAAYERTGTHKVIALRPDDDLQLGAEIKKSGFRADVLYGNGQLGLEWYTSLKEFTNGLMKNTFSVFDYNLLKVTGAVLSTLLVFVLPVPFLVLSGGQLEIYSVLGILITQFILLMCKNGSSARWWYVLMIPYAGLLISYIMLKSAFKTIRQQGIYWRESFYPLTELKKNKAVNKYL